ncbi:MAG: hypothetical protein MI975_07835 [Cytophagales bacterium]|nr:hypothetical protein [Cytophagales bacterium]
MNKNLTYRLNRYKRKYYLNLIFKGSIYILTVLVSAFLFFNLIEYQFQSNSAVRAILFFGYLVICAIVLYKWLITHLVKLLLKKKQISDEGAAINIGNFYPEVRDKLLNLVQLKKIDKKNDLLLASIDQRSNQMQVVSFENVISFKENVRYIKYLVFPFLALAVLGIISPKTITEPTKRIIQFNKEFIPVAPFQFSIQNENLLAFRNEDFVLNLKLTGDDLPESVYLITDNRKVKLQKSGLRDYKYNFEKIQESSVFSFEAAGFHSKAYTIDVVNRPRIKNFNVSLLYPSYLNRAPENLDNTGSFQAPDGTLAKWSFSTSDVTEIGIKFGEKDMFIIQSTDNQSFGHEKSLRRSEEYAINLKNDYSQNKEAIKYHIEVIPDEFPKINLDQLRDTVLFQYLIFGGNISDDYGLSDLSIYYKTFDEHGNKDDLYSRIKLNVDKRKNSQSFYYHWRLDEFKLQSGEKLEYYLQVSDNDGINGRKSTRTARYTFEIPTIDQLRKDLKISSENAENQIDNTLEDVRELNEKLQDLDNKLKGKKELSWQDQKQIEELVKQKEALDEAIKKMREQFDADIKKRDRFDKFKNEEIKNKMVQLQQLMDELLDEETKKLYEELQKLLEEQSKIDDLKKVIDKLNSREGNFEKELERTLELFKKMKFEFKLNENIQRASELQKKQEQASKNTLEKSKDQDTLKKEQQQLNEEFDELKEEINDMQELNQDLERPKPMQDTFDEQEAIENLQKEAQEQLQQNKNKKAGKAQQGASQQMKKLSEKLQSMQSMMMQSQMNMNLNQLRDILDNLIKLSFEQESVMNDFRRVHQSDPRFLDLSQKQLKIKDNAKVIQDSLISLAKNDFRIQSVVTRKVNELNQYLDESANAIKERKKGEAIGKQQYVMTSVNDLALMLDDVMSQMMNSMGMGSGQPQNARVPSLSELQQQLGEKINELKKSGKSGRQLSEELAKMAAEQERIRQMLQEMEEQLNDGTGEKGGNSLKDLEQKMEQSELDLVNKQLTDNLIRRQQEIVTRLLEAEKAKRERDLDDEREAQQAKDYKQSIPKEFEEYIKAKEKEIELLKTVPAKLNPYYKKEVNEYFKRLGS